MNSLFNEYTFHIQCVPLISSGKFGKDPISYKFIYIQVNQVFYARELRTSYFFAISVSFRKNVKVLTQIIFLSWNLHVTFAYYYAIDTRLLFLYPLNTSLSHSSSNGNVMYVNVLKNLAQRCMQLLRGSTHNSLLISQWELASYIFPLACCHYLMFHHTFFYFHGKRALMISLVNC